MPKKIAYIGEFQFPHGAATTKRALSLGRLFAHCGYNVSFYCLSPETASPDNINGIFENFHFSNLVLKNSNNSSLRKLSNWMFSGYKMIKLFAPTKPDYIVLTEGFSRFLLPLLIYAKRHNIKIIVDAEDWHEYSHLPFGKFGPFALDTHLAITLLMKKCDGIIAISSFFERYYLKANVKAIRVPILIDKKENISQFVKKDAFNQGYLHLIYAGNPGKRDIIDVAIYGLDALVKEGIKVKIHLVGPSRQSIENILGHNSALLEQLKDSIVFHGRVNPDEVLALLANADFSFLIRSDMRYAHAGFPSKFVESLSAGLPVICNLTSDIGMYLKDGQNGFVMNDTSIESFVDCVRKASFLSEEKRMQMKLAAKTEAHEAFDYRNFIAPVKEFFLAIDAQT